MGIGRVLRDAGHEVRLATAPGMERHIRSAGIDPVIMGFDIPRPGEHLTRRLEERYRRWLMDSFSFWVDDLHEQAKDWSPDVLLHDWTEAAGMLVAQRLGIPSTVLGIELRPPIKQIAESPCWLGFDFDELGGTAGVFGDLLLNLYPPCLATPGDPRLEHEHYVQVPNYDGATADPPDWLGEIGDTPLIYVTIGTFYGRAQGFFERIIESAAMVDAEVVVTSGPGHSAEEFAPLPTNVRVEQYVPQSLIIPHCAAVICHSGLTVMVPALAHGIPVGCVPLTWGTPEGFSAAERCEQLGAAMTYPIAAEPGGALPSLDDLDPQHIHTMMVTLLQDAAYRRAAERIQAEITSLPGADHAVQLIEAIAR